jgi:hypothetical protein
MRALEIKTLRPNHGQFSDRHAWSALHPWHPGWTGWAYWDSTPDYALMIHYTGHVLANLAGSDEKRMRCEFQLLQADEGMKGGGEARCQQPSGKTIKADFPRYPPS